MSEMRPAVGSLVHYVSYGSTNDEYLPTCRAAMVAEVGQWITEHETGDGPDGAGRPVRHLTQVFYDDALALAVINPTGMFFNGAGAVGCMKDVLPPRDKIVHGERTTFRSGTWHWPLVPGCTE